MESLQAPGLSATAAVSSPERRARLRHRVQSLAYVNLDHSNGGIIRDLSEDGLAIRAVRPPIAGQTVFLRFDLLNPRARIEAHAQVVWSNGIGEAGLRFENLAPRTRTLLRDWMLLQMLQRQDSAAPEPQMKMFSAPAAPEPPPPGPSASGPPRPGRLRLPWWPRPVSRAGFVRLVDTLIVLAAILLFSIISVSALRVFPALPWALASGAVLGAVFGIVFRVMFGKLECDTPGAYLAVLAAGNNSEDRLEDDFDDDVQRFR